MLCYVMLCYVIVVRCSQFAVKSTDSVRASTVGCLTTYTS